MLLQLEQRTYYQQLSRQQKELIVIYALHAASESADIGRMYTALYTYQACHTSI